MTVVVAVTVLVAAAVIATAAIIIIIYINDNYGTVALIIGAHLQGSLAGGKIPKHFTAK